MPPFCAHNRHAVARSDISHRHALVALPLIPCNLSQIGVLVDAARDKLPVPEGFQIIIDSMAGL